MPMREARVYDRDFPTHDQIISRDPDTVWPKEVWLQQMQPGEFAVRYKDFKTGLARNPAGEIVQLSEICRIFSSLEEARADSRGVAAKNWTVRCFIYDHGGAQIDTISNNKEVGKFAVASCAAIFVWAIFFPAAGMVLIGITVAVAMFFAGSSRGIHTLPSLNWLGWLAYFVAGLVLGVTAWWGRILFTARKRSNRMQRKLKAITSAEERRRFEELNLLHGSKDPAERERFLKIAAEYRQKIHEALKK